MATLQNLKEKTWPDWLQVQVCPNVWRQRDDEHPILWCEQGQFVNSEYKVCSVKKYITF